jgi:succinate dehydrogenase / fumarate reductase iron-sulfur subunit
MKFSIYRYNPDTDPKPAMQAMELDDSQLTPGMMLLDALLLLKAQDESLSFRRSCGEGVCPVEVRPLPGQPVIRDLIVDLEQFYRQYREVSPWLINKDPVPEVERRQTPEQRAQLDGLYECILCACCSTSCPSFWWNPDKFLGPAALLQSWRFLADSRDQATDERLANLEGPFKLFRCHTIMNCVEVCPKGLNPTRAIGRIKELMIKRSM